MPTPKNPIDLRSWYRYDIPPRLRGSDPFNTGVYEFSEDYTPKPIPLATKPAKNVPFTDINYGAEIIRITDHANEAPVNFAVNEYSRRDPYNVDSTYVLIFATDGYWHLYNADTHAYIRLLSLGGGSVEPHWHPTDPVLLYKLTNNGGSLTLMTHNVLTDVVTVVADLGGGLSDIVGYPGSTTITDIWPTAVRMWTKAEGAPSTDARYWAFMIETSTFETLGFVTYDMQINEVIGVYDLLTDGGGIGRPDHISMSPTGQYVVASWNSVNDNCADEINLGTVNAPCGLMSFTPNYSTAIGLASKGPHSDIALDINGNDVIVITSSVTGDVEMITLDNGTHTFLWNKWVDGGNCAMHISGKAYNTPGWVLISTYNGTNSLGTGERLWIEDALMIVELVANPRIYMLANCYNKYTTYWNEPHASVNKDFTKIIFNTNWMVGDPTNTELDLDAYVINLPVGALV